MADRHSADGPHHDDHEPRTSFDRLKRFVVGPPRDLKDRRVYHNISVAAFLAWVGLGADGLSSSAYGPEETFVTLGQHTYLAVGLAMLVITTVFIISACYSRIIERFPHGGGGYLVATKLLGDRAGVISGSALLIDYVLTITVSIAAAGEALFSFIDPAWHGYKLPFEVFAIIFLTIINLRGVKESITILMPVFVVFLITHAILIFGGIFSHIGEIGEVSTKLQGDFKQGLQTLGWAGLIPLFLHAYSLGGGTYTGIEAVSNGMAIMREPRVKTAKRTMIYMAVSLSLTAGGLILCYLLWNVTKVPGKTLNADLCERFAESFSLGAPFVIVTLISEGALLIVAAQAGFIDGPRVLANMALDSWLPRRFSALSERLTSENGILLMGLAALLALLYTHGDVRAIVVMYSINVFLTFSLSLLGVSRAILHERKKRESWIGEFLLFAIGFGFCATILCVTVFEKFLEGGWITLVVTAGLALLCFQIRSHYKAVTRKLSTLYSSLADLPVSSKNLSVDPIDKTRPTAVFLVGSFSGLGIHTILIALRTFPGLFKNAVFVSSGIIDSGAFKGADTMDSLTDQTRQSLEKYVELARSHGIPAEYRMSVGTDVVDELESVCRDVATEFHNSTFFAGQLVFEQERWFHHLLHNDTAFALQRRLQFAGHTIVILPARVV